MSGAAFAWALKQPVPMSPAKFVLVVMADQVTTDLAFMSVAALCEATGQDRKTVIANLRRLVEWGLIEDTGERRGRTGQIPVYRLKMGAGLFDNAPFQKGTENGTVPKTVPVPKTDGKSTDFPAEESQKRDTDPKLTQNYPTHTPRARDPGDEQDGAHTAQPPIAPPGALATRAMIVAGMPATRVNPSHPELLAAIGAGVTPAELADVVRECISRGTGPPAMVYVIRTAVGRRKTAAHQQETTDAESTTRAPGVQDRHGTGRARSAVGRQLEALQRLNARGARAAADDGRTFDADADG